MIGRVSRKTEADSLTFVKEFNKIAVSKGYNNAEDLKNTSLQILINSLDSKTSRIFQNLKINIKILERRKTCQREKLNLSREEIYALASIVYKESGGKTDEQKKTIAGLYINRKKRNETTIWPDRNLCD